MDLMLHGSHAVPPSAARRGTRHFAFVPADGVGVQLRGAVLRRAGIHDPIAGSAYTYAYATLGELIAWIIGWDLILEYAVSNMAVAAGFSGYLQDVLENLFGWHLPPSSPCRPSWAITSRALVNLPALIILLILTYILVIGVRESAETNNVMVASRLPPF